jgi:acetylornithine deacetylase/succinyl-diaminopimelate desuccinylase-like protein
MDCQKLFATNQDRYIDEWKEFLRFPSISTGTEHAADCQACADWLVGQFRRMGLNSRLLETAYASKPVAYAEHAGKPGAPTILFYGHYDVQPVDPLNLWTTPPFEPTLRDGRVYARGAQDNKGQVFAFLKALETLQSAGTLDCTLKILIEGEEESGSKGITESLEKWKDLIRADILMVSDTSMAETGAPAIMMGLRGIISISLLLHGPDHDLHSGIHGGVAPNPAQGMARLLASLHRTDGSIAVPGYYDCVTPPSDEERRLANAGFADAASYREGTGVDPVAGEHRFTPAERVGFRPSIDVNGIHTGFGGKGFKTVLPAVAEAKISARLAAGQDPVWCRDAILRHLQENVPPGLRLEVEGAGIGGPGFRLNLHSEVVKKARAVLDELTAHKTMFLWEGASVPIVSGLARVSGAEPLLVGFGLEKDRIHAPNESYSIEQLRLGYLYACRFLTRCGRCE